MTGPIIDCLILPVRMAGKAGSGSISQKVISSLVSLGDLREKVSRECSGQSVSLLNHLKQGCFHGTVSCNVSSIKFNLP